MQRSAWPLAPRASTHCAAWGVIPYRGAAPAVQDVLGNQVPVLVIDTAVGLPHLRSGKLVALGVFSRQRLPTLPDVATLEEQGLRDSEVHARQGMVVPIATPRDVVVRLSTEVNRALASADVSRQLQEFGLEPLGGTPEQMPTSSSRKRRAGTA